MTDVRFSAPIVGARFHQGAAECLAGLPDGSTIELRREPTNKYDRNAIAVYCSAQQLGFVQAAAAKKMAPIMDARMLTSIPARFDKCDGSTCFAAVTFTNVGGA